METGLRKWSAARRPAAVDLTTPPPISIETVALG
jgi:hypothetical protein